MKLARIELWNGDICELEVDAIVNAANLSLWMSTGVGGALKRVGLLAEFFAHRRRAGRQWSIGRTPVAIALAGHRALAADIERAERVQLTGVGNANRHTVLLLHSRIGRGWFHAAKFDGRAGVLIEIGQ